MSYPPFVLLLLSCPLFILYILTTEQVFLSKKITLERHFRSFAIDKLKAVLHLSDTITEGTL